MGKVDLCRGDKIEIVKSEKKKEDEKPIIVKTLKEEDEK